MQNTGNLCQALFDRPKAFSKMLGIPVYYIQHFQTILAVLSSKKALLDPMGFKAFCDGHLDEKFKNKRTNWNHHNTTGLWKIVKSGNTPVSQRQFDPKVGLSTWKSLYMHKKSLKSSQVFLESPIWGTFIPLWMEKNCK